jgi:uncharacterized NAD(P)/FAD-binding protein YdhS
MKIAIIGGGPAGLFMFKRLIESGIRDLDISVFEKTRRLGVGMPYSAAGANDEHITNVSGNEIPDLVTPVSEWIKTVPANTLAHFHINEHFNDYKVFPRLFFGQYLADQFSLLLQKADDEGIRYHIHFESTVTDVVDNADQIVVQVGSAHRFSYDVAVICTGHYWPKRHEGIVPGYFDSPYPPSKLALKLDHPVAIKGASLTAVDAVRTLARHHGEFIRDNEHTTYRLLPEHSGFKMILHTRGGMLPAVRFHLEDSHLENDQLLSPEEIAAHIAVNDGFLSLDFVFEHDFKEIFRKKEPEFYQRIKHMSVEEFVTDMMELREKLDPFELLRAEYAEAEKSIKRKKSVYWKEMLGVLSFAMNYPAKHLSAEDMQRLQKVLLPLISIVIAYIPQSSTEELLALHLAGLLDIIPVGDDSHVEPAENRGAVYHYTDEADQSKAVYFKTFVDCVGQPHLNYIDFPFKSLLNSKSISPARLKFRSAEEGWKAMAAGKDVEQDSAGNYYLHVSGITINDNFQVIDQYGAYKERIYMMAVPYIGGYNPDYSGLDFCEEASGIIINNLLANERAAT